MRLYGLLAALTKQFIKASARGRSAYRRGKKAEDNAARDIRRNWLRRNEGYRRQVPFSTPYGKRTLDGAIYNKRSGQIIEGVEVKSGNSRYGGLQKKKDAWIQKELGIPVSLYHRP